MMLPTAWALGLLPRPTIVAVLMQVLASAGVTPMPGPVPARDSVRLVRRARGAQSDFEILHRSFLPMGHGGAGGGSCEQADARVGRFCYWSDDGSEDDSVPTESKSVVRARARLLATLDSIGTLIPGDDWVAGQRVRYRIDGGDTASAVAVARSCGAATWWCAALGGLALHEEGDFARADSAFDVALAAMPRVQRCHWSDISLLLDGALADRYHKLDCARRDSLAAQVWWLSAPLYLVGTQDLRTEILSRVTRARIEEDARNTQSSWSDDMRELMLRYGWSTWYSRVPPSIGSMLPDNIIGHEASPTFNFLPVDAPVDSPFAINPNWFAFRLHAARMRYAPRYVRNIHPLDAQLSVFRRGDSALVVAAFDVSSDTALVGRELSCGLFLWTESADGTRATCDHSAARHVLTATAAWQPLVIGVEALARQDRNAARYRIGRYLRPQIGGISVSDLLLYAPADTAPHRLADVLPEALPTSRVHRREPLGLFWETYGLSPAGEQVGISVTISRERAGLFRRAAEVLHLATRGTPLSVRWEEKPEAGSGIASRGVTVDLSRLPPGGYRVQLTISPEGRQPVVVSRAIEIVE